MKKISIKSFQAKLNNAQLIDATSKKNLKGGATDPPPFGTDPDDFTDPPPFGNN